MNQSSIERADSSFLILDFSLALCNRYDLIVKFSRLDIGSTVKQGADSAERGMMKLNPEHDFEIILGCTLTKDTFYIGTLFLQYTRF